MSRYFVIRHELDKVAEVIQWGIEYELEISLFVQFFFLVPTYLETAVIFWWFYIVSAILQTLFSTKADLRYFLFWEDFLWKPGFWIELSCHLPYIETLGSAKQNLRTSSVFGKFWKELDWTKLWHHYNELSGSEHYCETCTFHHACHPIY